MNFKQFNTSDNQWHDIPYYQHKTATDTLTLPAVIYPNDTSITVGIKGQSSQASTPSPSSPVSVDGCGEKTANLFDDHNIITIEGLGDRYGVILPEGTYSIYNGTDNIVYDGINDFQNRHVACEAHSTTTITLHTHPNTTCGFLMALNAASQGGVTIVSGSKPPSSYIPYGYKIPILNNSQTTNVYLGEVQTTRKIKKLVFTGAASETWVLRGGSPNSIFFIELSGIDYINNTMLCTHFINQDEGSFDDLENNHALIKVNADLSGSKIAIRDTDFTTTNEFKTWLSQQYVNGTPVTVWYALATPETAVVNEPLRKIGDYADSVSGITIPTIAGANTLSIGTTLQPSETTVNYKGWHPVADVHERESGAWT